MSRLPVSVIVTASGSPDDFRACLESLRPTLGVRDEVVCVVPADRTDLRAVLGGRTWLTVIETDSADQAARWSAGCDATRHPVVVLLDGDVLVSAHWLDPVAEALSDPDVVAAGPRCHLSYGPQSADVPRDATASIAAFKAYARQWRQEHAGRFSVVDRLGPVCVAIRRSALTRAGGPTQDLPYEELRTQGRLVVADGALVAHVGSDRCALRLPAVSADAPLLSASLIVKDEEDVLAECLTALREFVDEIVVYDTGSTDRTREIAREHGARVIDGYWDDHFGDARNRALGHCTGQWVLVVDADEVATGDPAEVRAQLSDAATSAFLVGIESWTGHGTGRYGRQLYPRLFRRSRGWFTRRLHEQVVDRVTGSPFISPQLTGLTLLHSGYTALRSATKDKGERNLRLATLSSADRDETVLDLADLARSQLFAGRVEEVIDTCKKGLALAEGRDRTATGERDTRITFLRVMMDAYALVGKLDDAHSAIHQLRQISKSSVVADEMEARILFEKGDFAGAYALVEAFPENAVDDGYGIIVNRGRLANIEVQSLFQLGRHHEAADRLRAYLRKSELPLGIPQTAAVLESDGSNITELADLLPRTAIRPLLLTANDAPDTVVDDLLEALWQQHRAAMILASAARIGSRLPVIRAMEWAARLRQHGLSEHCTLLSLAENPQRTPRDRVLAAAVAAELFSDERAIALLEEALGAVPDDQNELVLADLRQLAPQVAAAVAPASVA